MEIYKGDIFYITGYKKSVGSEQNQDRPAVVVSNDINNKHSTVVEVVFLTSTEKAKYLPTHVNVLCKIPSVALCEQVNSISKRRLGEYIRSCTDEEIRNIDKALMISLGVDPEKNTDDQKIDDLKMKLEGSERMLDEAKAANVELKAMLEDRLKEIDSKSSHIENMKTRIKELEKQNETEGDAQKIKLLTERNLYRTLYDEMVDKLFEGLEL